MADNKLFEINPCPRCGLDKISIGLAKQIDDGEWLCELECRACFFSVWSTDEQIDQAVEQAKLKWTGNTLYSEQLDDLHLTLSRLVSDSQWAIRETEDGFHLARNDEKKSSVQGTHVTYPEGKSHCLSTNHVPMTMENIRIRRLTPRECWRLQGFPDWAFDRAKESGVSDTQLYRQAGNSVTVNVVYEIAKRFGD